MLLMAFTLQDRMAVHTICGGQPPISCSVLNHTWQFSVEVLSGPGQNHLRNSWSDLIVEETEFQCLDSDGIG